MPSRVFPLRRACWMSVCGSDFVCVFCSAVFRGRRRMYALLSFSSEPGLMSPTGFTYIFFGLCYLFSG